MIEQLKKNTAQLADWQFREAVVEKINEIINFLTEGKVDLENTNYEKIQEMISETVGVVIEKFKKEEREAKEQAEKAAAELDKQNAGGSQV